VGNKSKCIWLTGLPCSGKTTIANELNTKLKDKNIVSVILDGDELRSTINSDLSFDVDSRNEAMRRVAHLACLLCSQNITVIVSVISPLKKHRQFAKSLFTSVSEFYEIYLSTELKYCEKRDVKGMYKKARENIIKDFTGIGSKFESPEKPFLSLDTERLRISDCVELIMDKIFIDE
tara:strand:- start:1860 stop:2390 length:531 start_codon:yes stop_codon:yes gene_type:complete